MTSLGERLKQIRQEAGLSPEDLSEKTKIQKKYIEYLESENFDKLPGPVYARAFIRKYARCCQKNPDNLLAQFYRENKLLNNSAQNNPPSPDKKSFVITSRHIIITLLLIVSVSLLGYFAYNQKVLRQAPSVEITAPEKFSTVSEADNITLEGETRNIKQVFVNGQEIGLTKEGGFRYTYPLGAGLNTIIIKAIATDGKHIETVRKVLKL